MNVTFRDLGIVNGLHTVEVIDTATGETIGYNQSAPDEEIA